MSKTAYHLQLKDFVGGAPINRSSLLNNPDKFPEGYVLEYSGQVKAELVKNFDQFNLKHSHSKTQSIYGESIIYVGNYPQKSGCYTNHSCNNRSFCSG